MSSKPVVSVRVYVLVFLTLLVLTAVTTFIAFFDLGGGLNNAAAITIAVCKALLVILYYMHLKFDSRLFTGMFLFGMVTAAFTAVVFLALFGYVRVGGAV